MGQRSAAISAAEKAKKARSQLLVRITLALSIILILLASQLSPSSSSSSSSHSNNGAIGTDRSSTPSETATKDNNHRNGNGNGNGDIVMNVVVDDNDNMMVDEVEIPSWPPIAGDGYPIAKPGYTIAAEVQRIRLNDGQNVPADELVRRQTPLIMTNGPAEQWNARRVWSPDYLRQRVRKQIKMVYKHRIARFGPLYRPSKPLGVLSSITWSNPHEYVNMTSDAFFDYISNPVGRAPVIPSSSSSSSSPSIEGGTRRRKKPEDIAREREEKARADAEAAWDAAHPNAIDYLYYTGDLDRSLITDLLPIDDLVLTTNRSTINIWIGQAGVLAHTHMDSYDNFFVQIHGRKRFLLFDPTESANVYPYPFLHPSHGQCQVNIDEPDFNAFPNQRHATAYVADLAPGDMLYLPPLWFHSVLSIDQCISISVWSISHEQDIFDHVIQATVKSVDKEWSQPNKRAFAYHVITDLLNGIANQYANGNDTRGSTVGGWEHSRVPSIEYIRRMRDERYGPSVTAGQITTQLIGGVDICNRDIDDDIKRKVDRLVAYAIELFGPISGGRRAHWLSNYIESLVFWSTGGGQHSAPYLYHCFNARNSA